jgi:hypothetical protein
MYRALDPDKIVTTLEALEHRISARFSKSGLARICSELTQIARESSSRVEKIGRRNVLLRSLVVAILAGCGWLLFNIPPMIRLESFAADNIYSVLQGIDSAFNILVLMGAAVFFLFTVEERIKRKRALDALHELRSIAHVIDMHQLTKDPSMMMSGAQITSVSPTRTLTPFELTRYLDYCSEMLSLSAKVAALYAQSFPDPVVTDAVSDLERVTTNLSQKIWQKISLMQPHLPAGIAARVATDEQADA